MSKTFVVNANGMTASAETPEDAKGKFTVISSADQLVDQFDKPQLILLRENIRGKKAKADEGKSLKKLAFECFQEALKDKKAPKTKKEAKERKPSKVGMAKKILAEKSVIGRKELGDAIGHDEKSVHVMMSILKNSTRTKEPIFSSYNKDTAEYTVHPTKEAMDEAIQQNALEAQQKKDADKAEKEAEKAAKKKEAADKKAADKAAKDEEAAAKKQAEKDAKK